MADLSDSMTAYLRRGAASSTDLQRALAVSQPTVSRLVSDLGADVIRTGRGRSTRYGLRREIAGIGHHWPVFQVDESGRPIELGRLQALHADQYWFSANVAGRSSLTHGLPYFIQDLRPQGFVGRAIPRRHPDLGLPERITDWNDDQVLTFLVRRGEDGIGNILLGDESLERYFRQARAIAPPIDAASRFATYEQLAQAAIAGDPAGSSAGGEHPKFTCLVSKDGQPCNVLVKFSPDGADPVSRRWYDLLVSEHVALATWSRARGLVPRTELVSTERRVFLESQRFDRVGAFGRRGVISLAALDDEFIGRRQDWVSAARDLRSSRRISNPDFDTIRRAAAFGRVIANTDMHFGNLSFFLDFAGPYALAPLYDMLPMRYAPTAANVLPDQPMDPPVPMSDSIDIWDETVGLGVQFWSAVARHQLISPAFAELAGRNARVLEGASRSLPI